MARALIVGCGCRGRSLGGRLLAEGWAVRGTSRREEGLAAIEAAGMEPARADPEQLGTVLDLVHDVAVVYWLLGSARGEPANLAAIHGERLERVLERLVETPVRGFAYEAGGSLDRAIVKRGSTIVRAAGERWRIPIAIVESAPGDHVAWVDEMLSGALELASRDSKSV